MSSIASPTRTEGGPRAELLGAIRTLLAAALLTALLVTLTPFQVTYQGGSAGNVVNQIGYGLLGAVAILSHLVFTERAVLVSLLRPTWLLLVLFLVGSALHGAAPADALRAVAFTLLGMATATAVLCLPPTPRAFRVVLVVAAATVLGLSYAAVILAPGIAIHSAPPHAGFWRGLYAHKNVTGPAMATLFFCGIYLLRCRLVLVGTAITLGAALFVFQTGSRTAAALMPAVAALVMFSRLLGHRAIPVAVIALALAVMAAMTLGSVLVPFLDDILQAVLPGTTFTGRVDLWRFAIDRMAERQWTGFGFESFWLQPPVLLAEPSDTLAWDPRGSPTAHNGFLDVAIAIGWPGLVVAVLVLAVLPFADYVRAGDERESALLADLFLMVLAFVLLNAFLESFLFDRANPIWMSAWISVVGLRLLARHRTVATG